MPQLTLDPGTVVEEGPLGTVAVNRNQDLLGKLMLMLNRPCEDVRRLQPPEWLAMAGALDRVTAVLDGLFAPDLYNYAFLMNADPQVHLHVLPRYSTSRTWGGFEFTDPDFGEVTSGR